MRTNQLISCTAVSSLALLLALVSPVARAQENLVSQEAVDAANDRIQTWIPLGKYPVSIMVNILVTQKWMRTYAEKQVSIITF